MTQTAKGTETKISGPLRAYRKGLKRKRYKKIRNMLTDKAEREFLDRYFREDAKGTYRYQAPSDKRTVKKLNGILGKVKKARQGPRRIRLVLLLLITAAPLLFGLFFLDKLASRQLEKSLETLTETDVGVQELDIQLLKGRLDIAALQFASVSDPETDALVLSDLTIDFGMKAFFYRSVNIEEVGGTLAFNAPRAESAVYPVNREQGHKNSRFDESGFLEDFDWMALAEIPDSSVRLARQLRIDAESQAQSWQNDIEADTARIETLVAETRAFMGQPLPAKNNPGAWLERINQGRRLAGQLQEMSTLIEKYSQRMEDSIEYAESGSAAVQNAMERDLAILEQNLRPDGAMINLWISSAIEAFLGEALADVYRKISALTARFSPDIPAKDISGEGNGRMKRGRLVSFPVESPPRFTVGKLLFEGEGVSLKGSHLGVDQDKTGYPSEFSLQILGIKGLPEQLDFEAVIDGRIGSADILKASLSAENWLWTLDKGTTRLSGAGDITAGFTVPAGSRGMMESSGRVSLGSWRDAEGELGFLAEGTPNLNFNYLLVYNGGIDVLRVSLADTSLRSWAAVIAKTFLPGESAAAGEALEQALDAEFSGIREVQDSWIDGEMKLGGLDSSLKSAEAELEGFLNTLGKNSGSGVPIPAGGLEGLKSLF